ncbi:hypothetical protein ACMHYB_29635 [Sorangium sp. So ce1128]
MLHRPSARELGFVVSDIASEGVLLHSSGAFTLTSQRMPSPAQRREQAERAFERWLTSTGRLFIMFEDQLSRAWLNEGEDILTGARAA